MAGAPALSFAVRRSELELVTPARATPYEFKALSDIDDQDYFRAYRSNTFFYRANASKAGIDPAKVIKSAISELLVPYYPLAGRIRELNPTRKLVVECTGEGVVFVEADADVRMDDFGSLLAPPVPGFDKLLPEPQSSMALVIDRPLAFVQVTRLRCGGFVFGCQICHCIADGPGQMQILMAMAEVARGVPEAPTLPPVWQREHLTAPCPPAITHDHREYAPLPDAGEKDNAVSDTDDYAHHAFFFGPGEIASLRSQAPEDLRTTSSLFDLVAAFMWRCHTAALRYDPDDTVRVHVFVNARARNRSRPPLPWGYYGNAVAFGEARALAGELRRRPFGNAVRLLSEAKARAAQEGYVQSAASFIAANRRPPFPMFRTYLISDLVQAGMMVVDFGWGSPVYGGPAKIDRTSFLLKGRNEAGEDGIVVPVKLPAPAMERMMVEVKNGLAAAGDSTKSSLDVHAKL